MGTTPDRIGGDVIDRQSPISKGDATAQVILAAAIELFARTGFEASSTRAIATAANVHHALLRHYFGDKDKLWRAAVREMFRRQQEEFRSQQDRHPIAVDAIDGLKEFVRRYVRYCALHPEHAQILVHEAIADTARLDWAITEFVKANTLQILGPLERQTAEGNLRLDDAVMSSILLSAASQMVFVLSSHLRRVFDQDVRDPAFVERVAESIVTLIFTR